MARKIPFSVDITGSFVYSEPLVEARKLYHDGVWSSAKLHEIEDKEIYRIVEKCKEIGLKCVTDGDYKSTNYLDFFHHLENITKQEPAQPEEVKESVISGKIGFDNAYPSTPKVTQRFTYLTGIIGGDMYAKVLLPSPATLLAELLRPENRYNTGRYYPDMDLLVHDIAQTYQTVISEFYDMGCRFLQLSDYAWNLAGNSDLEQVAQAAHIDLLSLVATSAKLTEACLAQKPDDMCISLQFHEKWWRVGDKEKTAELLLSTRADAIALDFGDRENENIDLSMLNYCQGKEVILGLISTSSLQPHHAAHRECSSSAPARVAPPEQPGRLPRQRGQQHRLGTDDVEQNRNDEKYCEERLGRINRSPERLLPTCEPIVDAVNMHRLSVLSFQSLS